MGLVANVYRCTYKGHYDLLNGFDYVTLTNVEGPSQPSLQAPAAYIEVRAGSAIVKPDFQWMIDNGLITEDQAKGAVMDAGILVSASDSRFGQALRALGFDGYVGLHVHSYVEPWAVYNRMD